MHGPLSRVRYTGIMTSFMRSTKEGCDKVYCWPEGFLLFGQTRFALRQPGTLRLEVEALGGRPSAGCSNRSENRGGRSGDGVLSLDLNSRADGTSRSPTMCLIIVRCLYESQSLSLRPLARPLTLPLSLSRKVLTHVRVGGRPSLRWKSAPQASDPDGRPCCQSPRTPNTPQR